MFIQTFNGCVSGEISTYNTWNPKNRIDRYKYSLLISALQGISRQPDRHSKPTKNSNFKKFV